MTHVLGCKNSAEMWEKLMAVYERTSEVSIHLLQQQFFNCKLNENDEIALFVTKLEGIVNKLKIAGEVISEQMFMTKVLMALPEKFKHFISAWQSVPVEDQKVNNLLARLITEEERLGKDEKYESSTALLAERKEKLKYEKKKIECFNCGKAGHFKRDCRLMPKKHKDMRTCHYCRKVGHLMKDCWFKKSKDDDEDKNAFVTNEDGSDLGTWYMDSAASEHMCNMKEFFKDLKEANNTVKTGSGAEMKVKGRGTVDCLLYNGKKWSSAELKNVLYVPELQVNLFSLGAALNFGYKLNADKNICKLLNDKNEVCAMSVRDGKMFKMKIRPVVSEEAWTSENDKDLMYWHEVLAHQNFETVKSFLKAKNIPFKDEKVFCRSCVEGKQHRETFKNSKNKAKEVGELVQVIFQASDFSASDFSSYRTAYFLKHKSEVGSKLKNFLKMVPVNTGKKVKVIRSDNGTEFVNHEVMRSLEKEGALHQKTVPYTPEQNGRAERENRTVIEAARTMLRAAQLGKEFWAEATNAAIYTLNRSGPTVVENKTPFELWFNKTHDLNMLKVFGSEVYVHVPKEKRRKWDSKSKRGLIVGYGENVKGFRIYIPEDRKIEISRDVIFVPKTRENCHEVRNEEKEASDMQTDSDENIEVLREENQHNLRDRRTLRKPERFEDYECYFAGTQEDPLTFQEAMKSEDATKWKKAIDDELHALEENNTWTEIEIKDDRKVIDSKWVFKKKVVEGNVKYKARLVARGFQQDEDFGYSELYSPVAKLQTIHILLAVANHNRTPVYQMDVCSAFLHGEIKEDVYLAVPDGIKVEKSIVLKLNKSLYGLRNHLVIGMKNLQRLCKTMVLKDLNMIIVCIPKIKMKRYFSF